MLFGVAEHFDVDFGGDDGMAVGRGWGTGWGKGLLRKLRYKPRGYGVPDLPPAKPRGKTFGVLRTSNFDVNIISGDGAYAYRAGTGRVLGSHVEMKAIGIMQRMKVASGTLYLNRKPCLDARGVGCDASI
jgi:hypothetical protein